MTTEAIMHCVNIGVGGLTALPTTVQCAEHNDDAGNQRDQAEQNAAHGLRALGHKARLLHPPRHAHDNFHGNDAKQKGGRPIRKTWESRKAK